jgi:hypothetical protein
MLRKPKVLKSKRVMLIKYQNGHAISSKSSKKILR